MESNMYRAAKSMWEKDIDAIRWLEENISDEQYRAIYDAIEGCKGKIAIMGMGTSGIAARKIAHMIRVADFPAFYLSPGDCAHGGLGAIDESDLLIAISKSGTTTEIVSLIPSIKRKNVRIMGVTAKPDSPIGKASDMVVRVDVPESDHKGITANAGIIAVIALFDAIADELTNRVGYSEEVLYYNHIHGGVGDILRDKLGIKE